MVITLGNIVFGGKGNGGSSTASAYVVPDGMNFGYTSLTEFPFDDFDFSQKTNFYRCWHSCSSLTEFPQINISKGTIFSYAWYYCSSLKSFPQLDLSGGTDFNYAWAYCQSLTEFPAVNLSNGTGFERAWYNCYSLASLPALNLLNGTNFNRAWYGCQSLTTLGGFGAIKADIDLSTSTLLTAESLMNVITQAATVTSATMKLGSTNLAKLTDEQKAVATSKGWTLA